MSINSQTYRTKTVSLLLIAAIFSFTPVIGVFLVCPLIVLATLERGLKFGLLTSGIAFACYPISLYLVASWQSFEISSTQFQTNIVSNLVVYAIVFLVSVFFKYSRSLAKTLQFIFLIVSGYFLVITTFNQMPTALDITSYLNCLANCNQTQASGHAFQFSPAEVGLLMQLWAPGKLLLNIIYLLTAHYWLVRHKLSSQFEHDIREMRLSNRAGLALFVLSIVAMIISPSFIVLSIGYCALVLLAIFGLASIIRFCFHKQRSLYWLAIPLLILMVNVLTGLFLLALISTVDNLLTNGFFVKQSSKN